jgi:hypothetical protein
MWACILGRWLATLKTFVYFWLGIGFALGLVLALVVLLGGEITAGPLLIFFLFVLTVLLAFLIWDLITCLVSPTTPVPTGPPLPGAGALTAEVDCATAQQMLADARAQASQLQAEIQAQIARVAAAQQAANVARMSLTAAVAGLAGCFFAPWALPAALAAVAAATYLAWRSAKNLEDELAKLEALATRFAAAQRDIAADELLVSQSCSTPGTPNVPSTGGIGLTTGALPLIARGRGRCGSGGPTNVPTIG